MGGRTWCESVVGEGSTFCVTIRAARVEQPSPPAALPMDAAADASALAAAPSALAVAPATLPVSSNPYELSSSDMVWLSRARVLLVSQRLQGSMHNCVRLLRLYGATVEHVESIHAAKESLRAASASGAPFQLVVLEEGEQLRHIAATPSSTSPSHSPPLVQASPLLALQELQRQLLSATTAPCRVLAVTDRHYMHVDSNSGGGGGAGGANGKATPRAAQSSSPSNPSMAAAAAAQQMLLAADSLLPAPMRAGEHVLLAEERAEPAQMHSAALDRMVGVLPKPFKHQTLLAAVVRELRLLSEGAGGSASPGPVGALSPRMRAVPMGEGLVDASTGSSSSPVLLTPGSSPPAAGGAADDRVRQMLMRTATKTSVMAQPSRAPAHSSLLGQLRITDISEVGTDPAAAAAAGSDAAASPPLPAGASHARRKYGIEPIAHQVQLRIILAEGQ